MLSFGCLASSLTQSQAIAAIIALGFNLGVFIFAGKADDIAARVGGFAKLVGCLALTDQLQDFARGIVDTRAIVSLLTLTIFFLALTLRVVESRRWK